MTCDYSSRSCRQTAAIRRYSANWRWRNWGRLGSLRSAQRVRVVSVKMALDEQNLPGRKSADSTVVLLRRGCRIFRQLSFEGETIIMSVYKNFLKWLAWFTKNWKLSGLRTKKVDCDTWLCGLGHISPRVGKIQRPKSGILKGKALVSFKQNALRSTVKTETANVNFI